MGPFTAVPAMVLTLVVGFVCAGFGSTEASPGTPPAGGAPGSQTGLLEWRAGRIEFDLLVHRDSLRYTLPAGWIRPETFRLVQGDTVLVRGVDFLLDPRRGTVRLLRPPPDGTRLRGFYQSFPVPVQGDYRRHRPSPPEDREGSDEPGSEQADLTERIGIPEEVAKLDIAGSKTFAVELGSNQDLALQQTLDLAVNGRVGRDVQVRAILTDRDTPIQPEGTSAQLEELDRVLVEVEGPTARMTLGDFELVLPSTEFALYRRRLEGVRGEASPRSLEFFGAAASSPGRFVKREFFGQEGRQGPYRLLETSGLQIGAIVAGTERVWLDGRRLTRGENEDYIIDYADGTISFASRHPITAYSEITVDFQQATDAYRRRVYAAGGRLGEAPEREPAPSPSQGRPVGLPVLGPASTLRTDPEPPVRIVFLTEGDDRDRPVVPLTDAQKAALEAAGDSLTPELLSGIAFVGEGQGDYQRVENDTLLVAFFLWVGAGNGDFRVRFDDVGPGRGDYRDSTTVAGDSFFVYVGPKKGRFVPGESVAPPQSASLLTLRASPSLGSAVRFRWEAAGSDFDANTFSSRDDGNNRGGAFLGELESAPVRAGPVALKAGARLRYVDPRFHSLDRLDPGFYFQDWNVDPRRLEAGDRRRSVFLEGGGSLGTVRLTVEDLDNWTDFRGERGILEATASPGMFRIGGRVLRARSRDSAGETPARGVRETERVTVGRPGSLLEAGLAYTRERNERGSGSGRTGDLFHDGSLRVGSGSRFRQWRLGAELSRRVRWTLQGETERRLDVGDTGQFEAEWRREGGRLLAGTLAARELRPVAGGARISTRLGRVRWIERQVQEAFIQEGRWELSTSVQGGRVKEIRYVGEGEGHFDSLGVYQGIGDYEVFYRDLPDSLRINAVDFSLRSEIDLSRILAGDGGDGENGDRPASVWDRVLRSLRVVHYWTARLESDRSTSWLWPRMIAALAGARDLPRVDVSMRADATALPGERWFSPRFRWEMRRSRRSQDASLSEDLSSMLYALRLRSRPGDRWTADQELEWEDSESRILIGDQGEGRDGWRSFRGRLEQQVRIGRRLTAGLDLSGRRRDRIGSQERARVFEATPFGIWSPEARSRVEVRLSRTSVARRDAGPRPASRELERAGWTARLTTTLRLRRWLDLTMWYRDTRPDTGRGVQDGRVELRATF